MFEFVLTMVPLTGFLCTIDTNAITNGAIGNDIGHDGANGTNVTNR